jgi:hypothetical protein
MNEIKEAELDRLNRKATHLNRYLVVVEKMEDFAEKLQNEKGYMEVDDYKKTSDLYMEYGECVLDILNDLMEENNHLRMSSHFTANALRHYVRSYGNHLVSEKFPDEHFMTIVTILPKDEEFLDINVKIIAIEDKDDN